MKNHCLCLSLSIRDLIERVNQILSYLQKQQKVEKLGQPVCITNVFQIISNYDQYQQSPPCINELSPTCQIPAGLWSRGQSL